MQTRQPITAANLDAHQDAIRARIASGQLDAAKIADRPTHRPVRGSAIRAMMVNTILDIGEGCTRDDLKSKFTDTEIATHADAAFQSAIRKARLN